MEDRLRLVQAVAHRRDVGAPERRAARAPAGTTTGQKPQAQRRHSGLPVRQDHGSGRQRARLRPSQKKVEGRKRHLLVDTEGLVLKVQAHSAKVPDQDGIRLLLGPVRDRLACLSHLWVDAG
jgi:Transposase DDE domain